MRRRQARKMRAFARTSVVILRPLGALLVSSCCPLGASRAQLGPSWGHLGALLVFCCGHLGAFGGLSWAQLGPSWCHLWASWGHLGAMLGVTLVSPWGFLGLLGASLAHLWPSWGPLGAFRDHLEAILGPLGANLGPLGAILGPWAQKLLLRVLLLLLLLVVLLLLLLLVAIAVALRGPSSPTSRRCFLRPLISPKVSHIDLQDLQVHPHALDLLRCHAKPLDGSGSSSSSSSRSW